MDLIGLPGQLRLGTLSQTRLDVRRHGWPPRHPHLVDMQVIVRLQNRGRCPSITYMIWHYVARRAKVIEDHPHNAASCALISQSEYTAESAVDLTH